MGLLSLEKYLNDHRRRSEAPAAEPSHSYLELSTRTLSALRRSVFTGESFSDLSEKLEVVRNLLQVESEQSAVCEAAGRVEALLETFQHRTREAARERANDFKNVLDILNETFTHLNAGAETSDARLKQLEAGLSRAAKIDDISTLRTHLSKMLDFVRQEGARDQDQSRSTIESLSQQIRLAQSNTSRFRLQVPGRTEAIGHLTSQLADAQNRTDLHAALFVIDPLRALRVRHGDEVAANILDDFVRKHIPQLAPGGDTFCWSPTSVLLVWQHSDNAVAPRDLPSRLQCPIEHRAFIGTRVATFNLVVRSVVMQATNPVDELVAGLDRFWKSGPGC